MKVLRFFVWVVPFVVLLMLWSGTGSPYVIWAYTFEDNGDPHNPFANRRYVSCTFTNFQSSVTVPARAGRCGWVRWIKRGAAS